MDGAGFLGRVINEPAEDLSADSIVAPEELEKRTAVLQQAAADSDLAHLSAAERQAIGDPATVEEIELNAAYAGFAEEHGDTLTSLGLDPKVMSGAFQTDLSLIQIQDATGQVLTITRTGALALALRMTQDADQVAEVRAEILKDESVDEGEHRFLRTAFSPVDTVRTGTDALEQQRRDRLQKLTQAQQAEINARKQRQDVLVGVATLKNTPVQEVAAPKKKAKGTKATKAGKKAGTTGGAGQGQGI